MGHHSSDELQPFAGLPPLVDASLASADFSRTKAPDPATQRSPTGSGVANRRENLAIVVDQAGDDRRYVVPIGATPEAHSMSQPSANTAARKARQARISLAFDA